MLNAVIKCVLDHPPKQRDAHNTVLYVLDEVGKDATELEVASLKNVLERNVLRTSGVYISMLQTVQTMWYYLLEHGKIPDGVNITASVRVLEPSMHKTLSVLRSMLFLSLKVHIPRYNEIIKEATQDMVT
jgi:hypothetical protein